jgi:hypothetical protein
MITFQVRPAHRGDAPALTDLLIDIGWFQHYFDAVSAEVLRERIGQRLQLDLADSSHSVYVAENSGQRFKGNLGRSRAFRPRRRSLQRL